MVLLATFTSVVAESVSVCGSVGSYVFACCMGCLKISRSVVTATVSSAAESAALLLPDAWLGALHTSFDHTPSFVVSYKRYTGS